MSNYYPASRQPIDEEKIIDYGDILPNTERPPHPGAFKTAVSAGAAALGVLIVANGCETTSQHSNPDQFTHTTYSGEATSLRLGNPESDAPVRHDPIKTDDISADNIASIIKKGDLKTVDINKEGVYIHTDVNGIWYGIPAHLLDIDEDKDGVVWVNEQNVDTISDPISIDVPLTQG